MVIQLFMAQSDETLGGLLLQQDNFIVGKVKNNQLILNLFQAIKSSRS
jgi:hypothetical protein